MSQFGSENLTVTQTERFYIVIFSTLKIGPKKPLHCFRTVSVPSSPVKGRPLGSKNKNNLNNSSNMKAFYVRPEEILLKQGPSIGALFTAYSVAQKLGIVSALGQDQQAKLALWQICARVIELPG